MNFMAVYNEKDKSKWTKDGRHWYFIVYYKDIDGKTKQKWSRMYANKDEAEQAEALFLLKRDNPIHKLFRLIADDYFEELSKIGKPSTYNSYFKAYKTHIEPFFINDYADDINTSKIRLWHDYMLNKKQLSSNGKDMKDTPLSIAYMNKVYAVLCNIFDFGIRNYQLQYNPAKMYGNFKEKKGIIKKDNKKFITFDEFEKFISNIDDELWYTYFNFLFYSATRKGEAMSLHWYNVDLENKKIFIKTTLQVDIKGGVFETTNKTDTERVIIMNDELYNVLYNHKKQQMQYADFNENWYVFGGSIPISKTTADRKKSEYFTKAGIHEITNHQFRHSLTTILCQEYVKEQQKNNAKIDKYSFLSALANRNGHSVETMLKYYAYLFPDTEQNQVITLLNNLKKY